MSNQNYVLSTPVNADEAGSRARLLYVTHAQYSAEWNCTPHSHTCAELFFITGGHGLFQVQNEQFPVAINDLVVVNAGVLHAETSQNNDPMEYVVLGVDRLETVTGISGYALMHLLGEQESVSACLRMIVQEAQGQQPGWDPVCRRLLEVILLRLRRREDFTLADAPANPLSNRECDLVRRYIDNHFKENITLDQLAAMAHINKYYLSHTFRKEFNTSPISYLINRRIQESYFLLSETDLTLSQIAQILGFSSSSYFSQSFRRKEGITPLEYRKRQRRRRAAGL